MLLLLVIFSMKLLAQVNMFKMVDTFTVFEREKDNLGVRQWALIIYFDTR